MSTSDFSVTSIPNATVNDTRFENIIGSVQEVAPRKEILIGTLRPPRNLAPYSHTISAEISHERSTDAVAETFGRFVILFDPDGQEIWQGSLRIVIFIQAELEQSLANDPLLPQVSWTWLEESISNTEGFAALAGTVTSTANMRYGEMSGPESSHQLELRASWTALNDELKAHFQSFLQVLELAAGLPPVGTTQLPTG